MLKDLKKKFFFSKMFCFFLFSAHMETDHTKLIFMFFKKFIKWHMAKRKKKYIK